MLLTLHNTASLGRACSGRRSLNADMPTDEGAVANSAGAGAAQDQEPAANGGATQSDDDDGPEATNPSRQRSAAAFGDAASAAVADRAQRASAPGRAPAQESPADNEEQVARRVRARQSAQQAPSPAAGRGRGESPARSIALGGTAARGRPPKSSVSARLGPRPRANPAGTAARADQSDPCTRQDPSQGDDSTAAQ